MSSACRSTTNSSSDLKTKKGSSVFEHWLVKWIVVDGRRCAIYKNCSKILTTFSFSVILFLLFYHRKMQHPRRRIVDWRSKCLCPNVVSTKDVILNYSFSTTLLLLQHSFWVWLSVKTFCAQKLCVWDEKEVFDERLSRERLRSLKFLFCALCVCVFYFEV